MNIRVEYNKLNVNGKIISFQGKIETVLEFQKYCIVLIMNDNIPDNNVEAIDYNGNIVWNISQIVKFNYPEAYISIRKESKNLFSAITYNGVRFVVDINTKQIVEKSITK